MVPIRHLGRAPIVEAVVDLRVKTRADFALEALDAAHERLKPTYERKEEMRAMEFTVVQSPGKPAQQQMEDLGKQGVRFFTGDGLQIVQFRRDGFTFSRLAPYTRWEEVFGEASRLWRVFEEAAPCEEVARIAVRYINRLNLPARAAQELSAFLTAPPPVPDGLALVRGPFVTRVTVSEPQSNVFAHITQALQGGPAQDTVPVILDLDAFQTGPFEPQADSLLPRFEALREFKNRLFFGSLTEEAISLFE